MADGPSDGADAVTGGSRAGSPSVTRRSLHLLLPLTPTPAASTGVGDAAIFSAGGGGCRVYLPVLAPPAPRCAASAAAVQGIVSPHRAFSRGRVL